MVSGTGNKQPSIRPFADGVLFPDFPERVFFHPRVEFFGLGSLKLRRLLISLYDYDVVRLEAVDECAGLRADQHLRMLAYGTKQGGNHVHRAGVQYKFRFTLGGYENIELGCAIFFC